MGNLNIFSYKDFDFEIIDDENGVLKSKTYGHLYSIRPPNEITIQGHLENRVFVFREYDHGLGVSHYTPKETYSGRNITLDVSWIYK